MTTEVPDCPLCGVKADPRWWYRDVMFCDGCSPATDPDSDSTWLKDRCGHAIEREARMATLEKERDEALASLAEASEAWDGPETADWILGVRKEAAHQIARWGVSHDTGKTPADWFWLIGFLAGKALAAAASGDTDKARHHTISTAAALLNWHAALEGRSTQMRPGISGPS